MKLCQCVKPDLHEVDGFAQCKLCNNWFNHDKWEAHWKGKVEHAIEKNEIGRNDPCPCQSGKKYKKCCQPQKVRRWIKKNPAGKVVESIIERGERLDREKMGNCLHHPLEELDCEDCAVNLVLCNKFRKENYNEETENK